MQRFLFVTIALLHITSIDASEWTVLIYMQADGALCHPANSALDALQESMTYQSDTQVRIYAELIEAHSHYRYCIDSAGKHELSQHVRSQQPTDDLMDACSWAFSGIQSRHTMLILSGHATGILSPSWYEHKQRWLCVPDIGESGYMRWLRSQNAQLLDIVEAFDCKSLFIQNGVGSRHLTWPQLSSVLHTVAQTIPGKKFTMVGFDACNMSMLEIAYDMSRCADFMIASQECEEKEGWDYGRLVQILTQETDPLHAARRIVYAYDSQQKKRAQAQELFSLSACDLMRVQPVMHALEAVLKCMDICIRVYKESFYELLYSARHKNHRFCFIPQYADIASFFGALSEELSLLAYSDDLGHLKQALLDFFEIYNAMTIATAASSPGMTGCSIYFPVSTCDVSYNNNFMGHANWGAFLHKFIRGPS